MDRPKRILQIGVGNFGRGGQSTIVLNFGLNQDSSKVVFDYLIIDKVSNEKYIKQIENKGGKVYELKLKSSIEKIYNLKKFFKNSNYETIHIHISVAKISTFIIQLLFKLYGGKTIILHSHSTGIDTNKENRKIALLRHNIFKKILPLMTDEFLACSKMAGEWLYPKKYQNRVKIINNGIDIEKYKFNLEKRNYLRRKMNLENKFILGHVGRFSHSKNHKFLIKIFNEVQKIEKESVLLLIGNGELEQEIKEKVKKINLEDKVIFLGVTDKVEDYLQIMDVFVFPSRFEGLGLVAIEAQASALEVIASDKVPLEARVSNYLEYFSLNQTPKEWAEKILEYKNGYERKVISKILEDKGYSIKNSTKELEKIYLNK